MDLRDDVHTQAEDLIKTLRVIAKLEQPSEVVWEEVTRWAEQAATILAVFIVPTIKAEKPYLDMRTGKLGNTPKIAPLVVGATSQDAAEEDGVPHIDVAATVEANAFMPPNRNGAAR